MRLEQVNDGEAYAWRRWKYASIYRVESIGVVDGPMHREILVKTESGQTMRIPAREIISTWEEYSKKKEQEELIENRLVAAKAALFEKYGLHSYIRGSGLIHLYLTPDQAEKLLE